MHLSADYVIRLQDGHVVLYSRHRAQILQMVFVVAVTDGADDYALFAAYHVWLVAVSTYALADFVDLLFGSVGFHCDDHSWFS